MPIYEKPTKELLKEFAATLKPGEVFTRTRAVDWFREHYPKIKPATVSMHVRFMSVNNGEFRRHFPTVRPGSGHDLFFQLNRGEFRLWDQTRDPPPSYPDQTGEAPMSGEGPVREQDLEEEDDIDQSGSAEFAYEADLRNYLAKNLASIERGLRLYVDEDGEFNGLEFPVDGRRIDILAVDANGDFLVIELKVSRGHEKTIGQLARYMAWVKRNVAGSKKTRGMIVARNASEDLRLAASIIPDVRVVEYQMALTFKEVPVV